MVCFWPVKAPQKSFAGHFLYGFVTLEAHEVVIIVWFRLSTPPEEKSYNRPKQNVVCRVQSFYTAILCLCVHCLQDICTAKTAQVALFTRRHDMIIVWHKKKTFLYNGRKESKRKVLMMVGPEVSTEIRLGGTSAPAVRAAVKKKLSFRNDTIILSFSAAN